MRYADRMPFLFFLALIGVSNLAIAQPSLPTFDISGNPGEAKAQIERFRVLIFPHFGAYSAPQGREQSATTVSVHSSATCSVYRARLDVNQEWVKEGGALDSKTDFTFKARSLNQDLNASNFYECTEPFTIQRDLPLKSFSYRGNFVVLNRADGIQIINVIDSDTYIKGVVPSEVEATWPSETLKAQAVAARTYAWWTVVNARKKNENFDLDDTVTSQAYLGTYRQSAATDQATDQTKGLVLKSAGSAIKAYFSADSGGFTEDAEVVFKDQLSYCRAKPEQYDLSVTKTAWTKSYGLTELRDLLVKAKFIPTGVRLISIEVDSHQRSASGRAKQVRLKSSAGTTYFILGTSFRYATQLRSTLFEVSVSSDRAVFQGRGYGHGVGMAQIGALEYARQLNWTFSQILLFYYSGATLTYE
jgi:SpoIID/LytB domain protein